VIADTSQRERALDVERSFIVQAPAGSGKTELLIRRYLALLPTVQKPEEILAITFTKKAAAEMKKRVVTKLRAKLGSEGISANTQACSTSHANTQACSSSRIKVLTIDAFCASLTRQMPVTARFGAQPENVQDEDARKLYREAARRALDVNLDTVARLLAHLDNDMAAATALLADLLAKRDQWLRKAGATPPRPALEAALVAERERLLARARALLPDASPELALELLTKNEKADKRAWRKRHQRAQELAGNEPLRQALAALVDMPPAHYNDTQWEALDAILALLKPAVAQLVAVFTERGEVDFTHVAQGAVLALGEPDAPTDLMLAMDTRIRHILVDEFQDTSVSQWELLERLTAGWEPGDGRTVFAVGDPMQSVYRFRDAEVGLFLHARREGLPNVALESLTLTTNFRSQAGVVDWVNGFFSRALPAADDEATGAVSYASSTAHHPALPGDAVTWHGFFDRDAEAARVVELCRANPGKAAILVRNRTHLDAIVPALKDAGIRFRAVEIEKLGEKQVVQDLYALTRALTHPADRIAWLAILRAPWCGLSLAELSAHFEILPSPRERGEGPGVRGDLTIWEQMQSIPSLSRITAILGYALSNRLRGTLRDCVEGTWLALGGPACVRDATELEDAEVYLDELERLEEAGALEDFAVLAAALESLYALPDVDAGPDAVEIMTIHKAKGLEFDTVIVPGLDRPPRRGDKPLFAWKSLSAGRLLLAPIDETGAGKDPIYAYVRELEKESEDIESGRLFYVAATRAESRLHLLGCAKLDKDGEVANPNKRTLLAKAWFAAAEHFPTTPLAVPPLAPLAGRGTGGEGQAPADVIHRLPADFAFPAAPAPATWTSPPDSPDPSTQIEFSWVGETARHVGTVVHRWLQRIAEDALEGWDAKRVERLRPVFGRELERRGVAPAELDNAVGLVVRSVTNSIEDERGRWILGPHTEARNEYRVRAVGHGTGAVNAGGVRTYVMDRVFTTSEGERWVVDYKTSRHQGANLEGFLDQERMRYAAQLETYASLLGDARCGLFFPLLGGWRT